RVVGSDAGARRNLGEETLEALRRFAVVEALGQAAELVQVFDPRLALRRAVEVMSAEAHDLDDMVDQLARPEHAHGRPHGLDLGSEAQQWTDRGLGHARNPRRVREDGKDVRIGTTCVAVDRLDGDTADLARRHRYDPGEAQRVLWVEAEAHVGDHVLDLTPLPEADAAHQPIRNAPA